MKKQESTKSWLHVLEREIGGKAEVVPEDWLTIIDIQNELEMTLGQTEVFVRKAVAINRMEKKQFRVNSGSGTRLIWHYKKKD